MDDTSKLSVAPTEAEGNAAANRAKGLVKVSMNFSPQTLDVLKEMSRKSATTMTEVVRRSIGLQKFVAEEIEAGGKLIIEDSRGKMKQVLLP